MAEIPFLTTKVTARKSLNDCTYMLEETGFEQVAAISDKSAGQYRVVAVYRGAQFEFRVRTEPIIEAIKRSLSSRTRRMRKDDQAWHDDLAQRAFDIGWRMMFAYVKSTCDSIKLGVVSPAQAFSGMLVIERHKDGSTVLLSDRLTENIEAGQFDGQNLLPQFTGVKK